MIVSVHTYKALYFSKDIANVIKVLKLMEESAQYGLGKEVSRMIFREKSGSGDKMTADFLCMIGFAILSALSKDRKRREDENIGEISLIRDKIEKRREN